MAHTVRDMMVGVVAAGSGANAQIPGVAVAGKTGTAQTGLGTSHTWFIAFAPAEAPRVAVAVMLENQPSSQRVHRRRAGRPHRQGRDGCRVDPLGRGRVGDGPTFGWLT